MAVQKTNSQEDVQSILKDEQLTDILLLVDRKNNKVEAVKDVDPNGNVVKVPADKKQMHEFMHIGHNSDALDVVITTLKNFYRQSHNPTEFAILRVPAKAFNAIRSTTALFKGLLQQLPSGKAKDFMDAHAVGNSQSQDQSVRQSGEAVQGRAAERSLPTGEERKPRFNEAMINWPQLESYGFSRQNLIDRGLLDGMLKGYKTQTLVPLSFKIGSLNVKMDSRLSFQQSKEGHIELCIHGIRKEPQLQKPYFGHIFSEDDKKNLRESGNMGRAVELKDRNGDFHPYLISIDRLTNEIVATRADTVFIPNQIKGIQLDEQDKVDLREGKKLWIEGMTSSKGTPFDAYIQINAEKRGIEYTFPESQSQRQIIGGVELSPRQQKQLSEGRAIFVEDMKRKDGELFSSFIKRDPITNNFSYTRYNPDTPEGDREIYIPKEIGGVRLEADEREALRKGQTIYLDGMVNRRGEEFSSYIKADLETGRLSYSRTPDGFEQQHNYKIPDALFGKPLTATQRAALQDGKAVLVEGMKGFSGAEFSSYVKLNSNRAQLDYYNENPDRPRNYQRNERSQEQSRVAEDAPAKKRSNNMRF